MSKKKIRIFEGFAGYGGGSFGLKRLKENISNIDYEVIGYSEFDKFASELFDTNHKDINGNPLNKWGQKIHMVVEQCLDILLEYAK